MLGMKNSVTDRVSGLFGDEYVLEVIWSDYFHYF